MTIAGEKLDRQKDKTEFCVTATAGGHYYRVTGELLTAPPSIWGACCAPLARI